MWFRAEHKRHRSVYVHAWQVKREAPPRRVRLNTLTPHVGHGPRTGSSVTHAFVYYLHSV